MKITANIILISKKSQNKLFLMTTLLEENDFRATNAIEIFSDYDLVVAKKDAHVGQWIIK